MGRETRGTMGLASWVFLVAWLGPAASQADSNTIGCQTGTPGIPIEQFRSIAGQGTIEMWPPNLQPAGPLGQPLPLIRDSTEYTSSSSQLPGAGGLEFFYDLDILEDDDTVFLYMAFNAG